MTYSRCCEYAKERFKLFDVVAFYLIGQDKLPRFRLILYKDKSNSYQSQVLETYKFFYKDNGFVYSSCYLKDSPFLYFLKYTQKWTIYIDSWFDPTSTIINNRLCYTKTEFKILTDFDDIHQIDILKY